MGNYIVRLVVHLSLEEEKRNRSVWFNSARIRIFKRPVNAKRRIIKNIRNENQGLFDNSNSNEIKY